MKLNISKSWFKEKIKLEENCEIGAGNPNFMKNLLSPEDTKNLDKLGVKIYCEPNTIPYVKWKELYTQLRKHKLSVNKFAELFGAQTMSGGGPYYYDVEKVLDEMINKKKPNVLTWD